MARGLNWSDLGKIQLQVPEKQFEQGLLLLSCPVISKSLWLHGLLAHQVALSLTISQSLPKFMSIASVIPSSHLIFWCSLPLLPSIFPIIRDFSSDSAVRKRWPKYWSFSFSMSPSSEYSGLISFKIDQLDLLAVQWTQEFSPAPQFEDINSLVLCLLYSSALTTKHNHWEDHNFDCMDLCWQRDVSTFQHTKFVIAFLPKSNYLLIS